MKRTPFKRKTALSPGRKAQENMAKFGSPIAPKSRHPASKARRQRDITTLQVARARWGQACIVPGCGRTEVEYHHPYPRGSHPEWQYEEWNRLPLCAGMGPHHREAQQADHWMYWAMREIADICQAAFLSKRPWPDMTEIAEIMARHRERAENVSPMGRSD